MGVPAGSAQHAAELLAARVPGSLLAADQGLAWKDLLMRTFARCDRQEGILVPAVPEPPVVWVLSGAATVEQREPAGAWQARRVAAAVPPLMQKQRSGHILDVSPIVGRKVFARLSVCCATKHAVTACSDGLRMEAGAKHTIRVTCIQLGAVETELYEQTRDPDQRARMKALKEQMQFLEGRDMADTVLFALRAPERVDVAELFVLPVDQSR